MTSDTPAPDAAIGDEFTDGLAGLGFAPQGRTRAGHILWTLDYNQFVRFDVVDDGEAATVSWSAAIADYLSTREMVFAGSDTGLAEAYPASDARVPRDLDSVGAEIRRTLGRLQIDLSDPSL